MTAATHDSGLNCVIWTGKSTSGHSWCVDNTLGEVSTCCFYVSRSVVDRGSRGKKDICVKKNMSHVGNLEVAIFCSAILTVLSPTTNCFPQRTVTLAGPQDVCHQLAHTERGTLDIFFSWIAWSGVPWDHFLLLSESAHYLGVPTCSLVMLLRKLGDWKNEYYAPSHPWFSSFIKESLNPQRFELHASHCLPVGSRSQTEVGIVFQQSLPTQLFLLKSLYIY